MDNSSSKEEEHDDQYWQRQLDDALERERRRFEEETIAARKESELRSKEIAQSIQALSDHLADLKRNRRRKGRGLAALGVVVGGILLYLSAHSGFHVRVVPRLSAKGASFEGNANQSFWDQLEEVIGTALIVVATVEAAAQIVSRRMFGDVEIETQSWLRTHIRAIEANVFELSSRSDLSRRLEKAREADEEARRQIDERVHMEEQREKYLASAARWRAVATEPKGEVFEQWAERLEALAEGVDRHLERSRVDTTSVAYLSAKAFAESMRKLDREEQEADQVFASIPAGNAWLSGERAGRLLNEASLELRKRT